MVLEGLDSATCLGLAVEKYGKDQVIALSICIMDKSMIKKIQAARAISEYYGVEHKRNRFVLHFSG